MKRLSLVFAVLALSACSVVAERAYSDRGADMLKVTLDSNYYWPQPVVSRGQEIEVFPIVTALVVTRDDGTALTQGDGALARNAANAHCQKKGEAGPGPQSRFSDGAWAFMPCS